MTHLLMQAAEKLEVIDRGSCISDSAVKLYYESYLMSACSSLSIWELPRFPVLVKIKSESGSLRFSVSSERLD